MKYHPLSKKLYSNSGQFLKELSCPKQMKWSELKGKDARAKICLACENKVLDTSLFTENELEKILKENSNTCLKIRTDQWNLEIVMDQEKLNHL